MTRLAWRACTQAGSRCTVHGFEWRIPVLLHVLLVQADPVCTTAHSMIMKDGVILCLLRSLLQDTRRQPGFGAGNHCTSSLASLCWDRLGCIACTSCLWLHVTVNGMSHCDSTGSMKHMECTHISCDALNSHVCWLAMHQCGHLCVNDANNAA